MILRFLGIAGDGLNDCSVEELSDGELQKLIDELKITVRRLSLETQMFQGYYERLARGGADLPDPGDPSASQVGSRKGSTSMTIDSMSECDSQALTSK